jgi:hypothetical protein
MAIASNFPAIRPTLLLDFANTKRLDPRVSFTRASTGRYYDGVTVAKAEENLLLRSQEFNDAAWIPVSITVTANSTTAPDGTSTAETLDDGVATAAHNVNQLIGGVKGASTYVFSCFLKDVDRQFASIAVSSSPTTYAGAKFDLVAGTAGSTQAAGAGWSVTSSSITNAGGGWYRCVMVFVPDVSVTSFSVRVATATDSTTFTASERGLESYTGTNKQIYVWGAQLEQRSAVTAYTATTTQPITNYIPVLLAAPAGVARFDHVPTTGVSQGLLIEEQRTNLVTYSEQFDDAAWTKTDSSITANTVVAPSGQLTGDKLVENTANAQHFVFQVVTGLVSGGIYTYSFFAKSAERTNVQILFAQGGNNAFASANLTAGTISSVTINGGAWTGGSATITNVGNGWYRLTLTATIVGSTALSCRAVLEDTPGNATYTGNGFSGLFIWGAQLEVGAFATSVIPTTTTALTRNADVASMTGTNFSSWYNQSASSFYAEVDNRVLGTDKRVAWISDATNTPAYGLRMASNNTFAMAAFNSGTFSAIAPGTVTVGLIKQSGAITTNDVAAVANGGAVGTNASWTNFTADKLRIGSDQTGGNVLNGTIRSIRYYPQRLTNAQLVALTG